ncbi:MAG: hypothetical protein M3Z26_09435 [Bacteroidota bacterium]|nr:hypothetical protein [Bacteroidota bacterium]
MVEVFKTNVNKVSQARKIIISLLQHFPESKINFDLDDCDRILKIEGSNFIIHKVLTVVKINGFECQVLE